MKRYHDDARYFGCKRSQVLRDQIENMAYYTLKEGGKKDKINLKDKSIKRLADKTKSKNMNKNLIGKRSHLVS